MNISVDSSTNNVRTIALHKSPHDLQHSSRALRKRFGDAAWRSRAYKAGSTLLRSTGASFLAPISFGAQSFLSVVDTGSADTWVVKTGFTCVDVITNVTIPQQRCFFGPSYRPGAEFQALPQNFNITYGDGEYLVGDVGTVPVTIAGIKIPKQQVSLASLAAWQGDGLTSGIIGLAYPGLTANYPGGDPRQDVYCRPGSRDPCNQIQYASLTNTIFQSALTAPVFALALSRDESKSGNGGYLSIGGVPNLRSVGVTQPRFASTPIKILPGDDRYRYYVISIEGVSMLPPGSQIPVAGTAAKGLFANNEGSIIDLESGVTHNVSRIPSRAVDAPPPAASNVPLGNVYDEYIVDSGTTLSFMPSAIVAKYASMFQPPARLDMFSGFYFVPCNAKAPQIGVKIGGTTF